MSGPGEETLRLVDRDTSDLSAFRMHLADNIILTQAGTILLQYRPPHWRSSPDCLNAFGGHVDEGEGIMQALARELNEELGARVREDEVVFLGALSEAFTQHSELVHLHFWHDRTGTITGCYEAEARSFTGAGAALSDPRLMPYTAWGLQECVRRGLVPV